MTQTTDKIFPRLGEISSFALFENELSQDQALILFDDLIEVLSCPTPDKLDSSWARIEEARKDGNKWIVLAASYEMGLALEPRLAGKISEPAPLLQAWIFARRTLVPKTDKAEFWAHQYENIPPERKDAGIFGLTPIWNEAQYSEAAEKILGLIAQGDCYQVNLTMPFTGSHHGDPIALHLLLREQQAVKHAALIPSSSNWILSRSPELFVEQSGDMLCCRPMKGTSKRGETPSKDLELIQALSNSEKNRAENLMIVDLIRNDLGRLALPGQVRTEKLFEIETYATLHQMTSTVTAQKVSASPRKIIETLFPCGSITGAPKIRAMEIISALEPEPRGIYCGALGWIAPNEDFRFSVPIRTLFLDEKKTCRLNVGSGIVADSTPADEYKECLLKARFATALQDEIHLLETMRWEPHKGIELLPLHLARLRHSAEALGFDCPTQAICHTIESSIKTLPPRAHRVRLQLHRQGHYQLDTFPLEELTSAQSIDFSPLRLDPQDPRLYHKTSARRLYNETLQDCMARGHFDSLFLNNREELCEGARSNLFLEKSGVLLTPKLTSGLLPGVLRAHLLGSGKAMERVLGMQDLLEADRVWVGNALRGLIPVKISWHELPSGAQFGYDEKPFLPS